MNTNTDKTDESDELERSRGDVHALILGSPDMARTTFLRTEEAADE